jgi:hypothetical protein
MKFVTHNTKKIESCGTSLMGYIDCPYDTLTKLFGEPTKGDEYKVDAEWIIEFEDGTVATIYNYKDGKNYCGADGLNKEEITNWHIGGNSKKAELRVCEVVWGASSHDK